MAFTSPMTAITGATFSGANFNTHVRDNLNAIWIGTTAGDIEYYTGATTKGRVAAPASLSLLQHNGTLPSYVTKGDPLELLRMNLAGNAFEFGNASIGTAIHYNATGSSYAGAGRDLPNSSNSIVTAVTCTIVMIARVLAACGAGNCWAAFACNIGGVRGNYSELRYSGVKGFPVTAFYIKNGVAPGTITLKIEEREAYGSGIEYNVAHKEWIAFAIPE